jgi:dedicator of cytokinesis protein 3
MVSTFTLNIIHLLGIVISLKMLHGELPQVREENPILFKNISLTRKLGFSDVIMPGDVRLV